MKLNVEIDFNKQPEELKTIEYIVLCLIASDKDTMADLAEHGYNESPTDLEFPAIGDIFDSLEDKLYIKVSTNAEANEKDGVYSIELRKKTTDLFPENKGASFDEFWDKYHEFAKKPKTDREAAFKHWRRLKASEQQLALDNVENYITFVVSTQGRAFIKKARTYLADKNFNDEFGTKHSPPNTGTINEMV